MNQLYKLVRYNYLTVTLYWLNSKVNLSLTVSLNKSIKDGNPKFCYTERPTNSGTNAYVDLDWRMRLRDIYSNPITGTGFSITSRNMYQFIHTINTMKIWFTDPKHKDLFMVDKTKNVYRCNTAYKSLMTINQYNEKLEVAPAIMVTDTGDHIPGAQIFLNGSSEAVFLKIQDYLNFDLFISTLNPTMMAVQLLSMFNAGQVDENVTPQTRPQKNDKEQRFLSATGAQKRNDS